MQLKTNTLESDSCVKFRFLGTLVDPVVRGVCCAARSVCSSECTWEDFGCGFGWNVYDRWTYVAYVAYGSIVVHITIHSAEMGGRMGME